MKRSEIMVLGAAVTATLALSSQAWAGTTLSLTSASPSYSADAANGFDPNAFQGLPLTNTHMGSGSSLAASYYDNTGGGQGGQTGTIQYDFKLDPGVTGISFQDTTLFVLGTTGTVKATYFISTTDRGSATGLVLYSQTAAGMTGTNGSSTLSYLDESSLSQVTTGFTPGVTNYFLINFQQISDNGGGSGQQQLVHYGSSASGVGLAEGGLFVATASYGTPEPASVSLLGFGCLALLRKRRRVAR